MGGWAQLHAALNDLPTALLLVSLVFDALGIMLKRDSLKAVGFWTLVCGVIGALLAAGAGLMAEGRVDQSARAQDLVQRHQTLALVVMGIFALLLVWRLVRRVLSKAEQPIYLTAATVGVILMLITARVGGTLVFDHGLGISTTKLDSIRAERPAPDSAPTALPPASDSAR